MICTKKHVCKYRPHCEIQYMSTYIIYMVCLNIACDLVHTAIAVRGGKQIYQNLPTVKKPHRTKNDQ